jgi:SAM-dependent MidA family methyltransferase
LTGELALRIAGRIRAEGPIPFSEFMETALYDPAHGYYTRNARIGERGDFVTSPAISPLFARAVARRYAADVARIPGPLAFVEAASGHGGFLAEFRAALADLDPAASARTRLVAIERTESGRAALLDRRAADFVAADPGELDEASLGGWVFSNELFDALPVHRVQMREGKLIELGVTTSPRPAALSGPSEASISRFAWTAWPAPPELSAYLARSGVALAEEQVAEINLEAAPLYRRLCGVLGRGRIVTFDYGHRARTLYHPGARPSGTLAVHSGGRRGGDPLEAPGRVDLTAHVNWDDLSSAGEGAGFETEGIFRQTRFLLDAGLHLDAESRRIEALRLLDPEGIGDDISALVQRKDWPELPPLAQLTSGA